MKSAAGGKGLHLLVAVDLVADIVGNYSKSQIHCIICANLDSSTAGNAWWTIQAEIL